MSFSLPVATSPLRSLFTVQDLLPYGEPGGLLKAPTFRQFINSAREYLRQDSAVRNLHGIVLAADGSLRLARVGRYSQPRFLWKFSK